MNLPFSYTVKKNKRRKRLDVYVTSEGILVRAPWRIGKTQIEECLFGIKDRLVKRLAEMEKAPRKSPFEGESITLFDREYYFQTGKPRIEGDRLYLPEKNEENFIRLLKKLTLQEMTEETKVLAKKYGFEYSAVLVSTAKTRWGSCSVDKRIRYSVYCAFIPKELREYVILHELCHTRVMNHSTAFWKEVEKFMPDWAERKMKLRKIGYTLNWI